MRDRTCRRWILAAAFAVGGCQSVPDGGTAESGMLSPEEAVQSVRLHSFRWIDAAEKDRILVTPDDLIGLTASWTENAAEKATEVAPHFRSYGPAPHLLGERRVCAPPQDGERTCTFTVFFKAVEDRLDVGIELEREGRIFRDHRPRIEVGEVEPAPRRFFDVTGPTLDRLHVESGDLVRLNYEWSQAQLGRVHQSLIARGLSFLELARDQSCERDLCRFSVLLEIVTGGPVGYVEVRMMNQDHPVKTYGQAISVGS